MKIGEAIRQGDVLLVRVPNSAVTERDRPVPRDAQDRVVVAVGESSLHVHGFRAPGVCLLVREGTGDSVVSRLLRVESEALLETFGGELAPGKPRHEPLRVPPGTYRQLVEREWTGEQVRDAED